MRTVITIDPNSTIDFNNYTYQNIEFVCNPQNNTFIHAPTPLNKTFSFINQSAFDGDTTLQTLIIPSANIIYTREYKQDVGFSAWISPSGGGGGGVNSVQGISNNLVDVDNTDPINPVISLKNSGTLPAYNGSALTNLTKAQVGLSNVPNVDCTNPNNLPVATNASNGVSRPDNSTITINNGVLTANTSYTLPVATTTILGGVKVDGSSIVINNGVISATTGGSGTVTNVSGTTNRVIVTNNTTTPVIDIDPVYAGQTSIATLGTITTGTWNGTTIAVAKGGTGATDAPSARTNLGIGQANDVVFNTISVVDLPHTLANLQLSYQDIVNFQGVIAIDIDINAGNVANMTTLPTAIANKAYVDSKVGGGNVTYIDARAIGGTGIQTNGVITYTDSLNNANTIFGAYIQDNIDCTFPINYTLAQNQTINVTLQATIANLTSSNITISGLTYTLYVLNSSNQRIQLAQLTSQNLTSNARSINKITMINFANINSALNSGNILFIEIKNGSGAGTTNICFTNQIAITVS